VRVPWRTPQMTVGWSEPAIFFSNFGRRVFATFRVEASIIMRRRPNEVSCRLSSDPKN